MSIGHTVDAATYRLICNGCEAERNEPFCQSCEPCDGSEYYRPRHDGFEAYEAELAREADARVNARRAAERSGDLVDILDN